MKAEHRKELQTNSLADFLGRTVRNVRGGAGLSWFKIAIVAVVLFGILAWYLRTKNKERVDAEAWAKLQANDERALAELMKDAPAGYLPAESAKAMGIFQYFWEHMRSVGGEDSRRDAAKFKLQLESFKFFLQTQAEACKEYPILVAEAKYNIAVCNEALAAFSDSDSKLGEARASFKELAEGELKTTAYGELASRRLAQYDDPAQFEAIAKFYRDLQKASRFDAGLK
jgi:hypothetical protein